MFNFFKKLVKSNDAASPAISPSDHPKSRSNAPKKTAPKSEAPPLGDRGESRPSRSDHSDRGEQRPRRSDRYGRGERPMNSARAPRPQERSVEVRPAAVPPKPEKLIDIPVAEGKKRFLDFPIHPDILFGVQHMGFQYCTPIQAMTLPHLLDSKDLAGKAQTGTGKTAAFLISAFSHLLKHPLSERKNGYARVLVLAPTRELAMQIHQDAEAIGLFTGLSSVVVFGGMDHEKQRRSLERPIDILIGTPGRIIDYSRSGFLRLGEVEMLIIDEADRMLDMGFIPDVKRIIAQLPDKSHRQTMLFSATLEASILRLASAWMTSPVVLESEPDHLVNDDIEQTFYSVSRDEKLSSLLHIINHTEFDRMLIFGNRKDVNLRLQNDLAKYGVKVPILSGDIPQEKRIRILDKFRAGTEKIVIATDVAARGIHVDDVSLVINYDLPERPEDYVHRIGRTGRAGHKGKSISFLCEYGAYNLPAIEKLLKMRFHSETPTDEMLKLPPRDPDYRADAKVEDRRDRRPRNGHFGGGRRMGGHR